MAIISMDAAIGVLDKLVQERAYSGVQEIAWEEVKANLGELQRLKAEIAAIHNEAYADNRGILNEAVVLRVYEKLRQLSATDAKIISTQFSCDAEEEAYREGGC